MLVIHRFRLPRTRPVPKPPAAEPIIVSDRDTECRARLSRTFDDYAAQAIRERRWEAAAAFQTASSLALGWAINLASVDPDT